MDYIYTELDSELIYSCEGWAGFITQNPTNLSKGNDEVYYSTSRGDILNKDGVTFTYKIKYENEPNTTPNITNIGRTFITQTKYNRILRFVIKKDLGEFTLTGIATLTGSGWNVSDATTHFICYKSVAVETLEHDVTEPLTIKFSVQ